MERVQVLIDKLAEQKARNDNAAQMLITVQLLQNELLKLNEKNVSIGTSKVSVIMPVSVMNQAGTNEKADYVTKLHAICMKCGGMANYSYRKIPNEDRIMVGEKDVYEPRCRHCYNLGT